MGQKANPISLRLQKTNRLYESSWYSNKNYNIFFSQDLTIRNYLNSILKQLRYSQARFFFKHTHKKVSIYFFLHSPRRSRKERANLLGSSKTRFSSAKSKFAKKQTFQGKVKKDFIKWNTEKNSSSIKSNSSMFYKVKQKTESIFKKQANKVNSAIIQNTLNSLLLQKRHTQSKKSLSFFKNLQNLNKQRINSLFYLLCGTSSVTSLNSNVQVTPTFQGSVKTLTCKSSTAKKPAFTSLFSNLEKQFFTRYFLVRFFSQNNSIIGSKKKNLLNKFLIFNALENELGKLLTAKYTEKTTFSALKDINLENYPKTKKRTVLANRTFTKLYPHLATTHLAETYDYNILNNNQNLRITIPKTTLKVQATSNRVFCQSRGSRIKQLLDMHSAAKTQNFLYNNSLEQKNVTQIKKSFTGFSNVLLLKQLKELKITYGKQKKVSAFITKTTPYRGHLESIMLKRLGFSIELFPFKSFSDSQSAVFFVNEIVYYLQQRVTFRRIKTRLFKEIAKKSWIKGIRISCSGRLGGRSKKAQRSKTECVKLGQTSLHVFSSKMDFAYKSALTPFGLVGIKVWISYK